MIFFRDDPIGVCIEYYRGHCAHAASAKYIGTSSSIYIYMNYDYTIYIYIISIRFIVTSCKYKYLHVQYIGINNMPFGTDLITNIKRF